MKKIFYFILLVCFMIMAACSSDDDEIIEEEQDGNDTEIFGEEIIIGADMPNGNDTRISVTPNGRKWELNWEKGDQLVLVGKIVEKAHNWWEKDKVTYKTSVFTLVQGAGTKKAKFRGKSIKDVDTYNVYYKTPHLKIDAITGVAKMNFTGEEQQGFNSISHVKKFLYLYVAGNSYEFSEQTEDWRRLAPADLTEGEIKKGLSLTSMTSVLRIDVRAVPENIKHAREVKWLVNNYAKKEDLDKTLAQPQYTFGLLRFEVGEIKDIRNEADVHQYLYLPFNVYDNQFICNKYFTSLVFSDRRTITRAVANDVPDGAKVFPGNIYDINVSVLEEGVKEPEHTLLEWDGLDADEIPVLGPNDWLPENQIKVKLRLEDGKEPLERMVVSTEDGEVEYKLVHETESEYTTDGWYTYETKDRIENIDGFLNEKYADQVLGLKSPLYLRNIQNGVCKNFKNLKELSMSPYVQNIGDDSFSGCTSLEKIEIPYCTRTIGYDAFKGFKGTEIIVRSPLKQLAVCARNAFGDKDKRNCTLRLHESWKDYVDKYHGSWCGYKFKEIIYIDDNGNDIKGPAI